MLNEGSLKSPCQDVQHEVLGSWFSSVVGVSFHEVHGILGQVKQYQLVSTVLSYKIEEEIKLD